MSKAPIKYLKHIRDECLYIISTIKEGEISKSEFMGNETLKRAIIRSLEIIGEATKNIPIDEKMNYPGAEPRGVAARTS